jgi:hypothetical protein
MRETSLGIQLSTQRSGMQTGVVEDSLVSTLSMMLLVLGGKLNSTGHILLAKSRSSTEEIAVVED